MGAPVGQSPNTNNSGKFARPATAAAPPTTLKGSTGTQKNNSPATNQFTPNKIAAPIITQAATPKATAPKRSSAPASAWDRARKIKDYIVAFAQNPAAITFWLAVEWSAILPVWTFMELRKDPKNSARILLFAVHVMAIATCIAALADTSVDTNIGIMAGSLLGGIWIVSASTSANRKESDMLVQCARAFSVASFILVTPLWFNATPFTKIARMVIVVCHAIAGAIITVIAMSAQQLWDAWSCYLIRPVPHGMLDHDKGLCTAPAPEIQNFPTIGGAVTPDGTVLEMWRKEIHVVGIAEAVAAAFYTVAIFKREDAPRAAAATIDTTNAYHTTARKAAALD